MNTYGMEEMNLNFDLNMEMNVNMLDQLVLLVQLSDVSVTNTNGYFLIAVMYSTKLNCKYEHIL